MIRDSDLLFRRPTPEEVLGNLTDFFYTPELQGDVDRELEERKKVVALLKQRARKGDIEIRDVAEVLQASPQAFNTLISIIGISQERFLGILTVKTLGEKKSGVPITINAVRSTIRSDFDFASGVAALLMHGREDKELMERVPPFDLAKLDKAKLLLKENGLVDSLLRLGLKGRYDAKKGDILEDHIEEALRRTGVQYVRGETRVEGLSRDLDFIVPNPATPYVLIESGLFETTARELSDKARVEGLGLEEIERKYPMARFVRVTDGVGWKRRGGQDLSNLIQASHYFLVFKTLPLLGKIVRYHVPKEFFK